jgi:sporulation protein YunB
MKRFKTKIKLKFKLGPLILILIGLLTDYFYYSINNFLTPKFIDITKETIDTYNNQLITNYVTTEALTKNHLNNIVNLTKNSKDEILAIDYNIEESYQVLRLVSDSLKQGLINTDFKSLTNNYDYDIKNGLILFYPLGLASNKIFLNNLGPKIPIKISFLNDLLTGINTKVTNYGINNCLVEMYLNITINSTITIPAASQKVTNSYDILLSAKVVMGQVPSYLGGNIENSSPILTN